MIYNQFISFYKKRGLVPTSVDLLDFIKSYKSEYDLSDEEIYKLFEKEFHFCDDYENVICPTLTSFYPESIIFKIITLGLSSDLSIYERLFVIDKINEEFHNNYLLKHKRMTNVLLSIYLEFISEYLLCNEYDKALEIAKELFLDRLDSNDLYIFVRYYINIFGGRYDSKELDYSKGFVRNEHMFILNFIYYVRIEDYQKAIEALEDLREISPLNYYLLGFRHIGPFIRDYKQLNLKIVNKLVRYYKGMKLKEPLINTDLFFFVAKVFENFIFCYHGWEKFNDYNRNYFLSKYDISQEDKMAILGIDSYLKNFNEPCLVYFKYLLTYLKNDEKNINAANNVNPNATRVFTSKFLEKAFRELVASHIVDVVDERTKVYVARDELHILADYYYQEMYMDTYNLATPFDENNYRKDN